MLFLQFLKNLLRISYYFYGHLWALFTSFQNFVRNILKYIGQLTHCVHKYKFPFARRKFYLSCIFCLLQMIFLGFTKLE